MSDHVEVDSQLLERAMAIGGEESELATVHTALEEYIAFRTQPDLIDPLHGVNRHRQHHEKEEPHSSISDPVPTDE